MIRQPLSRDNLAADIRRRAFQLRKLSDSQLAATASAIRDEGRQPIDRLSRPRSASRLHDALAATVEAVRRALGVELYDCQVAGAFATASGALIEMQTGEGKTLVTGVAAAARAITGTRVHVCTTNDYLAARDFDTLQPVFTRLGLSAGRLPSKACAQESRTAYQCDIVYGPGYQFGFDFLSDQLTRRRFSASQLGNSLLQALDGFELSHQLLQADRFEAMIVDEADSVLIDEALTPLILSFGDGQDPPRKPFEQANQFALGLQRDTDYRMDQAQASIILTAAGIEKADACRQKLSGVRLQRQWKTYVQNALRAQLLMHRNDQYVVSDGKVKIVEPFTGRIAEDRSWQDGLHQAIEVKEGVKLTPPKLSQVHVTRQQYISQYQSVSGLSGTLQDAAPELRQTYRSRVALIPTHFPCQRKVETPRFFCSWDAKLRALTADACQRHRRGQPILIGTRTIRESILVSHALQAAGLEAVVLNGLQNRAEAEIVAEAGQASRITIATNMAGRGTDIKLSPEAKQCGGLHVIGTEPNHCRRVDRQLIGRAARQGDPGSAQFFISAEDELIQRRAPQLVSRMQRTCGPGGESCVDFSPDVSQVQRAEEQRQYLARQQMVRSERWLDSVRECVFGED